MTPDTETLANTVREAVAGEEPGWPKHHEALDALVALVASERRSREQAEQATQEARDLLLGPDRVGRMWAKVNAIGHDLFKMRVRAEEAEARADRLQEALLEIEQTATADRDIALSEFVQRKLREAGA